jgi:hypothetical protein
MLAEVFHSTIKGIHLAPRCEDLYRLFYACDGLHYGIQHLEAWTSPDSRHRHHWKEERNLLTKSYKAKLERLRSARLTHHDQSARLLDMQWLEVVKDT